MIDKCSGINTKRVTLNAVKDKKGMNKATNRLSGRILSRKGRG